MLEDAVPGWRLPPVRLARVNRARDKLPPEAARATSGAGKRGAGRWLQRRVHRLCRLLVVRLRLVGKGRSLRVAVEPSLSATAAAVQRSPGLDGSPSLPAMLAGDVAHVRMDLAAILDRHPAARSLWPSLALIERGLGKHGGASFARMSVTVLRDAAKVLGRLVDDWCEPGLAALYEHVLLVLRTVHGEAPPYDAVREVRGFEAQVQEGSMTDFMMIDRLWEQRLAQEP